MNTAIWPICVYVRVSMCVWNEDNEGDNRMKTVAHSPSSVIFLGVREAHRLLIADGSPVKLSCPVASARWSPSPRIKLVCILDIQYQPGWNDCFCTPFSLFIRNTHRIWGYFLRCPAGALTEISCVIDLTKFPPVPVANTQIQYSRACKTCSTKFDLFQ